MSNSEALSNIISSSSSASPPATATGSSSSSTHVQNMETNPKTQSFDPLGEQLGEVPSLIAPSLLRVTSGLPRSELKQIIQEAKECEELLKSDIRMLEQYSKKNDNDAKDQTTTTDTAAIDVLLGTEFSPPDRFYAVSALLGRLREPLSTPFPPNSTLLQALAQKNNSLKSNKNKKDNTDPQLALLSKQKALLALESNPEYRKEHSDPTVLLAAWKKISSHRTAAVFRRPVNGREAPGYTERILFPIDLSLIRKMVAARYIVSFAELQERIGLICHNCLKFNGRESDYGIVTRDFEAYADECIVTAVQFRVSVAAVATLPEVVVVDAVASTAVDVPSATNVKPATPVAVPAAATANAAVPASAAPGKNTDTNERAAATAVKNEIL